MVLSFPAIYYPTVHDVVSRSGTSRHFSISLSLFAAAACAPSHELQLTVFFSHPPTPCLVSHICRTGSAASGFQPWRFSVAQGGLSSPVLRGPFGRSRVLSRMCCCVLEQRAQWRLEPLGGIAAKLIYHISMRVYKDDARGLSSK